jgi:hypothetical protein
VIQIDPEIKQSAKHHVSADSRKGFDIDDPRRAGLRGLRIAE